MTSSPLVRIHLLSFPVDLWHQAAAHQEAIQREFDILKGGLPVESVPSRLMDFILSIRIRFAGLGDPMWQTAREALEDGVDSVDLDIEVPIAVAGVCTELKRILKEVDEYCRAGEHLLTLVTPDEQVEFREWFLDEFVRQIHGEPPTEWESYRRRMPASSEGNDVRSDSISSGAEGSIVFVGDLDLTTANQLLNEIQEERGRGVSHLTIDLTRLSFIDSVGLSLLVSAHNRIANEGGRLHMLVPARMESLFEIAGLTDLLDPEFVDTRASDVRQT
jgi:anti-anti-sigma factor